MKRVFILGSGSSIGHSDNIFPSINDFFIKAKEIGYLENDYFRSLINYIINDYGHEIDTDQDLNIEALFTYIEIDIENDSNALVVQNKDKLLLMIRQILMKLQNDVNDKKGEYDEFCKNLNPNDTVITFNWDILLDNKLGRNENLLRRFHEQELEAAEKKALNDKINSFPLQYKRFINKLSAIHEQTFGGISVKTPYTEWSADDGYYLKLHGSIDWFYCKNENCRASNMVFPVEMPIKPYFCSECHERLENLIIPPILKKVHRRYPLIRRLWNVAIREIKEADEIVFWGYSLPLTDFYSDWLFRQKPKNLLSILKPIYLLKKIILINPAVYSDNTINTNFIDKFYKIFQQRISRDRIYIYKSFHEYSECLLNENAATDGGDTDK